MNLQFRSRWDSVDKSVYLIKSIENSINSIEFEDNELFDLQHSRNTTRNTGEIFFLTIFMPVLIFLFIILGGLKMFGFMILMVYYGFRKITNRHIDSDKYIKIVMWINSKCEYSIRKKGLFDSRYRSEIPAYSLSFYFFVGQMIVIWFPNIIYPIN